MGKFKTKVPRIPFKLIGYLNEKNLFFDPKPDTI